MKQQKTETLKWVYLKEVLKYIYVWMHEVIYA